MSLTRQREPEAVATSDEGLSTSMSPDGRFTAYDSTVHHQQRHQVGFRVVDYDVAGTGTAFSSFEEFL